MIAHRRRLFHMNAVIHPLLADYHLHQSVRSTAKGFQRLSRACGPGAYSRIVRMNEPFGASSQRHGFRAEGEEKPRMA
jgi:hypothetical protein